MRNLSFPSVLAVSVQGAGTMGDSREMVSHESVSTGAALWIPLGLLLLGFLVLLVWCLARGEFRNVERPAQRMLELEKEGKVKVDERR